MTPPSAIFGVLCAMLIGTIFHLVVDGGPGRLVLYVLISIVGFGAGHWLDNAQGWVFLPIGPLNLGTAAVGSLLALLVGHWLSKVDVRKTDRNDKV